MGSISRADGSPAPPSRHLVWPGGLGHERLVTVGASRLKVPQAKERGKSPFFILVGPKPVVELASGGCQPAGSCASVLFRSQRLAWLLASSRIHEHCVIN